MSSYQISKETYQIAKDLNVKIFPSKNKTKKIDVYDKDGIKFSIGDINYNDFHTYKKISLDYAMERKKLYHIRNKKYMNIINSRAYYAAKLLW